MTTQSKRMLLVIMFILGLIVSVSAMTLGSLVERSFEMWALRVFSIILFAGSLWLGYAIYQYFIITEEIAAEIEMKKAESQTEQTRLMSAPKPKDRIVPINTSLSANVTNDEDIIHLTESLSLTKRKLREFVILSTQSDVGLKISQWKKKGWDQTLVEGLLDYLCSVGLVTPRENGRACEYTRAYKPNEVLQVISKSAI